MSSKRVSSCSSDQPQNRSAGGVFIAAGTVVGALVGIMFGQPSIGFLSGLALGILIAVLIWLKER